MIWGYSWGSSWGSSWGYAALNLPGIAKLFIHSSSFVMRMTGVTWGDK